MWTDIYMAQLFYGGGESECEGEAPDTPMRVFLFVEWKQYFIGNRLE